VPDYRLLHLIQCGPRPDQQRPDLRSLEGDGRALGIVLVVGLGVH
jgi:hypothetical protein